MPTHFRKRKIENEWINIISSENYNQIHIKKSKKNNIFFRFIKLIIWIWIIWFIYFYYSYSSFINQIIVKDSLMLNIEKTDNFSNLWNKIEELDNIWYKYYLRNNKPDFLLREWTYLIEWWSNISDFLESLNKPLISEENVTILEWWNIFDIDKYFSDRLLINSWDFINYVTNKENIKVLSDRFKFLDKDLITLEWFLYPDTYRILANSFDIWVFVSRQLQNFENRVYNSVLKNYDTKKIVEIVNLASIVEKEERNVKEKPTVAWILKKRLNAWWMIWADITVCYPYWLTSKECTPRFIWSKVNIDRNDYNTRTKRWLPKTPINNPTFETINATLNHKDTKYWYYLHNENTWKIYYAETNAEHERNKELYMK